MFAFTENMFPQTEIFLKNLGKIEALARTTPAPFIAKVTRDDVVEIYDLTQ